MKDAVVVEARDGNLACWICMGLSENWVPKKRIVVHMFFIFPNPNSNIVAFLGIW